MGAGELLQLLHQWRTSDSCADADAAAAALVVRFSNRDITCQIVYASIAGDVVVAAAYALSAAAIALELLALRRRRRQALDRVARERDEDEASPER